MGKFQLLNVFFFFSICNNIVVVVLQINSHFSDKLLGVIRDMVVHTKSIDRSKKNEQSSEKQRGDATLEFIKHTCAVLALDQTVQHDVLVNCYIFTLVCCYQFAASVYLSLFLFSLTDNEEEPSKIRACQGVFTRSRIQRSL